MTATKTATAFSGETCYRCTNPAWSVCLICKTTLCAYHGWETHIHAQRVPGQLRGNAVDVTHKFICTDCLLELVDGQLGSGGRYVKREDEPVDEEDAPDPDAPPETPETSTDA